MFFLLLFLFRIFDVMYMLTLWKIYDKLIQLTQSHDALEIAKLAYEQLNHAYEVVSTQDLSKLSGNDILVIAFLFSLLLCLRYSFTYLFIMTSGTLGLWHYCSMSDRQHSSDFKEFYE